MPKKRKSCWSRNKKEKQIITARLIEISLKIDDYIYKHHLISVCEAEKYLKEVCSYKTECSQDERSLQVIEKLTRCMKAIILDHQELRPNIHGENNGMSIGEVGDRAGCISPVYSIDDEDRTQLTQIAEPRPIDVNVANADIEIIDLSNIDDDCTHNDINTAIPDYASSKITAEVDIHRGMSSLSLKDVGTPHKTSDGNCSQSILNIFEGVDQIRQNEINIVSQGAVGGGLLSNVADDGKTKNVTQVSDNNAQFCYIPNDKATYAIEYNKTVKSNIAPAKPIIVYTNRNLIYKAVVQNKEPMSVINTANNNIKNTNKDKTISPETFYPGSNNIHDTQTWYDSNRTCTINDSSHKFKDTNHFTQPEPQVFEAVKPVILKKVNVITFNAAEKENPPIEAATNSRALTNNTAIVQQDSTTIKKKRAPRKKKTLDQKEIKPKNKRVYQPPKSNKENTITDLAKNKILPIYNENVIDDLSWMENIRYVREIEMDENDPKLNCEDSFWDNYYLPANWSDNEFM